MHPQIIACRRIDRCSVIPESANVYVLSGCADLVAGSVDHWRLRCVSNREEIRRMIDSCQRDESSARI
jgi:hypothetical protein